MNENKYESLIKAQYKLLSDKCCKRNYQILFNIICAKTKLHMPNVQQSMYLDAKQFVLNYVIAADNEDYGYDDIQLDKIEKVVNCLPLKQRLSLLNMVRRLFITRGYDTGQLLKYISKTEIPVSLQENRYFNVIRLWLGASFCRLVCVYCIYIIIVGLVLLPAPYSQMEVFKVSMVDYYEGPILNHIANTLALICGRDAIAPSIMPVGIMGVILYCFGVLVFYFVFGNFIFKKMEDFFYS